MNGKNLDALAYEQYTCVVKNKTVSLNGLRRIVKHDKLSGWENNPDSVARQKVINDCEEGKIPYKLDDDPEDYLYGIRYPLPLKFKLASLDKN